MDGVSTMEGTSTKDGTSDREGEGEVLVWSDCPSSASASRVPADVYNKLIVKCGPCSAARLLTLLSLLAPARSCARESLPKPYRAEKSIPLAECGSSSGPVPACVLHPPSSRRLCHVLFFRETKASRPCRLSCLHSSTFEGEYRLAASTGASLRMLTLDRSTAQRTSE